MTDHSVNLQRRDLVALLIVGYVGAIVVFGFGGGLLSRAGVDRRFALAFGTLALALLAYPLLRTTATLRGQQFKPGFVRWAAVWIVVIAGVYLFVYPSIQRMIDQLFS